MKELNKIPKGIDDVSDEQIKCLAGIFDFVLQKRIKEVFSSLSYFAIAVAIAATFLTYKYYMNMAKIEQIETSIESINTELVNSRQRLSILEGKAKPENMDKALRAYMDDQIKQGPQVLGVDGKRNKER